MPNAAESQETETLFSTSVLDLQFNQWGGILHVACYSFLPFTKDLSAMPWGLYSTAHNIGAVL